MGLIDRIFRRSTVNTTHPRDPVLAEWFGGGGEMPAVTARTAVGVPAVYACVNVIAESISSLPLGVWRRDGESRTEAVDHQLHQLLSSRPCPHMSGVEWLEWMVTSTALQGDAFSRVVSDARGRITALVPVPANAVEVDMTDAGDLFYRARLRDGARAIRLSDDEMFRLPWKVQSDGSSLSPVQVHRESIALALAARKYQLGLMTNGAVPKGGVKVPTNLSDEAAEMLIKSWERRHKGQENAGRLAVFDGGLEWVDIGMSNEDAQFVEMMGITLRDVARIFRVQPHKIGDLADATFSNIEHQSIEFVTDTLLPWCRRIEARMEQWLLTNADRRMYSVEFNLRGLLRGDAQARAELYKTLFYSGALTSNEIRRMEGLNPIAGGDRTYVQTGSAPADIIDQVLLRDTPAADD